MGLFTVKRTFFYLMYRGHDLLNRAIFLLLLFCYSDTVQNVFFRDFTLHCDSRYILAFTDALQCIILLSQAENAAVV